MPSFPEVGNFLSEWWGGGVQGCNTLVASLIANASNVVIGGNPLYQISDFLEFYPKFGTDSQSISAVAINQPGGGYHVGDIVAVVQTDAQGAAITVSAVDGSGGVTGLAAVNPDTAGSGYQVSTGVATSGGGGSGLTVDITDISQYISSVNLPEVVLQTYINLASASLQFNRWQNHWEWAMGLYIAHFVTMYLRSEGSVGTTPQQVAASGLERGIKVAEAAGDVSKTQEILNDLEGWGAWRETTYGTQLVTAAKTIAMPLSVYVW